MLFVVQFEDVYAEQPGRLPERPAHMAAHLAFLAEHDDQVVAAGALRPSFDAVPVGGLWIVEAASRAAVSHWAKACWSPAFADCMAAFGAA